MGVSSLLARFKPKYVLDDFTEDEINYAAERLYGMLCGLTVMIGKDRVLEALEQLGKYRVMLGEDKITIQYNLDFIWNDFLAFVGEYRNGKI